MKKRVCRNCKKFVDENDKSTDCQHQFASSWQGRIVVVNAEGSWIAEQMGFTTSGEYAIKVR